MDRIFTTDSIQGCARVIRTSGGQVPSKHYTQYPVTLILYDEDLVFYASFQKEETFKTLQYHLVIHSAKILFVDSMACHPNC